MSDKPFQLKLRFPPIASFLLIAALGGCSGANSGTSVAPAPPLNTFIVVDAPPIVEAQNREQMALALLQAGRIDPDRLLSRADAQRVPVTQLPYLARTPVGQAFLDLSAPRAIARGSPPEACPATGIAGGEEAAGIRTTAAGLAIGRCLDALPPEHEICGCRVLALDNVLTVPREEMSYAEGTAARLISEELGINTLLVAEATANGDVVLRDLRGRVGVLRRLGGERVEVELAGAPAAVLEGRAVPVGFRRGRLAERILLNDPEGRRAHLLIGFSPEELETLAGLPLREPEKG